MSSALAALDDPGLRAPWFEAVKRVSASATFHGLLVGRCCRLLFDAGELEPGELARRLAAALSPGEEPARGANWVEGLVSGSGLLLVHDPVLLAVIDQWLASVSGEVFDDMLPLLRRSFARFEQGEQRQIARAVGRLDRRDPGDRALEPGGTKPAGAGADDHVDAGIDPDRARAVLPLLRLVLGRFSPAAEIRGPGEPAHDDGGGGP